MKKSVAGWEIAVFKSFGITRYSSVVIDILNNKFTNLKTRNCNISMKSFKYFFDVSREVSIKFLEEKKDCIDRVLFFLLFFMILFLIYALLNIIVIDFFPVFLIAMLQFSTPPIPGTLVRLDYMGFILPSVVTAWFIGRYFKLNPGKSSKAVNLIVFALLLFDLFFSVLYHQLRFIGKDSGSFDILATSTSLFHIGYLAFIDSYKEGILKAYIFGFLIGLISDIESIRYLTSTTVYGGGGLMDVDFVFPLIMLISFIFSFWYQKKAKNRGDQNQNKDLQ